VFAGNDISHRGGPPGFVMLDGLDKLRWPDYIGNDFFQTLGNLQSSKMARSTKCCFCCTRIYLSSCEQKVHQQIECSVATLY